MNLKTKISSIINHEGFKKYFFNTGWLMLEKVLTMVMGLFVGVWVARYLGPDNYGKLSYVMAFTGLFTPLIKLGLDGIISREVAKEEFDISQLLSTAFALRFSGSLLILIIIPTYMLCLKNDPVYFYLSIIISSALVANSAQVLELYFRAKVKGKIISITRSAALLLSSALKVFFILGSFGLVYFACPILFNSFCIAFLLFYFFRNEVDFISIKKVSLKKGIALLSESWPLIFGGFFAMIYLNIDQVMIESMLDSYSLGQYSAAVKISSIWYFIPLSVGWSVQTAIVNAKKHSEKLYYNRLQQLFTIMAIMAYALIIPISYFSNDIIFLLFGEAYAPAGKVLALHIVASLFVFVGNPRGLWVTNESFFKFALFGNICAGCINVTLNWMLLKEYGINGAAWSTLISYAFTFVLSGFFFAPARKVALMQLRSIFLLDVYKQFKSLKERV